MWEILSESLLSFIQEWGDAAIFLIFLLEEAGLPLPLPGDLALVWAGFRIASGQSLFVVVLLVVEVATLIGASTLYWLGLRGGRPLIVRYGRFVHIDESSVLRVEGWVGRHVFLAVFLGRIMPGSRIATSPAVGVVRVPYRSFLPALGVSTLLNSTFWIGAGFYFGPGVIAALRGPELTTELLISVVLLVAFAFLTWQIRRSVLPARRATAFHARLRRKIEAAVVAGLVATFEMATAMVVIVATFTGFPASLPERVLVTLVTLVTAGPGSYRPQCPRPSPDWPSFPAA